MGVQAYVTICMELIHFTEIMSWIKTNNDWPSFHSYQNLSKKIPSLNIGYVALTVEDRCHPLEGFVWSQARVLSNGEFQEEYGKTHGEQHDDVRYQECSCNTPHHLQVRSPELLHSVYRHPPTYAIWDLGYFKNIKMYFLNSRRIFPAAFKAQWDEGGGRILLGDNTSRWTVMLMPIRFQYFGVWIRFQYFGVWISTGLPWMYIHSWPYVGYTQFLLAQNLIFAEPSGTQLLRESRSVSK